MKDGLERMSWRWRFAEDSPDGVRALTEAWSSVEEAPGAREIKANLLRTVIALPATYDRPELIVKKYHVRDLFERIKYFGAASRAAQEWKALRRLRSGGVSVPRVFAMGEDRSRGVLRGAGLLLERVPDTIHINEWLLEAGAPPAVRKTLLQQLGEELGKLHGAGARHHDLHAGNVLVEQRSEKAPRIWLIDHHVCRFGAPPGERRRRGDLAKLFHSMAYVWSPDDALEFLRGYRSIAGLWTESALPTVRADLEQRAQKLEVRRLSSRSRRCWVTSSEFIRERIQGGRCYRRRTFPASVVQTLRARPLEFDRKLQERPRVRVGTRRVATEAGATEVVVKEYVCNSWLRSLWHAVVPSPLERAWGAARALDVRRIPTAEAFALIVDGAFFPRRWLLVTRYVGGAGSLRDELAAASAPVDETSRATPVAHDEVDCFADVVRHLHDTGMYHRDLNPSNVLVQRDDAGTRFVFVDLDSVRAGARLSERRRIKNLVQLGATPECSIPATTRRRFLHRYDRDEHRYWSRDFVADLEQRIGDAVVDTIGKFSRFEQQTRKRELPGINK